MRFAILLEPRRLEDRVKLYKILELARRMYRVEVGEVIIVAGGREQAEEARRVLAEEMGYRDLAEEAFHIIRDGEFWGVKLSAVAYPLVNIIVIAVDYNGLELGAVIHELTHIVAFRETLEEKFFERTKKLYQPFFALVAYLKQFGAQLPRDLLRRMNDEYIPYFVETNYIVLKRIEPNPNEFIPALYEVAKGFIEYCYREATKFYNEILDILEYAKSVGFKVEPEIEREIRGIRPQALINYVYRSPTLPLIAHEIVKPTINRYPAELYEEFKDVWG